MKARAQCAFILGIPASAFGSASTSSSRKNGIMQGSCTVSTYVLNHFDHLTVAVMDDGHITAEAARDGIGVLP